MTPDQKAILALTADNERLRGLLREAADDKLLSVAIELGTTKARLAEAVRMIEVYKRAGWLTNPAAIEQADDFIARVQKVTAAAAVEPCKWCGRPVTEQTERPADYCVHDELTFGAIHATAISASAICPHGIRSPWECRPCADAAYEAHQRTSASASGVQYKPCGICTTQSWCETHGCQCYPVSAVQPERCCVDYPRCDCNSPPEPDDDWLCFQRPTQPKVTP